MSSEDDIITLFENATNQFEFSYKNETVNYNENERKTKIKLYRKLRLLKNSFSKSDFIFPSENIYEFIEYTFQVVDILEQKTKLLVKLKEVIYSNIT